jgi:hypothetical protein
MMFREGTAHLWKTTTTEFNELGVGVSLYFRLLKYLSVLFWLLTLMLLPSALLYMCGDGLGGDVDLFSFAVFTPANFVRVREPLRLRTVARAAVKGGHRFLVFTFVCSA